MDWNAFKGAAKRIENIDIPRVGHKIGVGEDELHAFMDVEAAGSGFDANGRPKVLFEPHVFYRNLTGVKRTKAIAEGLAYSRWGAKPYPKDSYPRLFNAMAIDETAALKSASWGLGQVLGENHRAVGYATPQAMVRAFMADEEKHLEAIVEFLIANHIDDDLKAHRWEVVARVYNGPGYSKHNYHGRMAAAYAKWRGIKDTPWPPGQAPTPAADPILRYDDGISTNLSVAHVNAIKEAQRHLRDKGYYTGLVDGMFGRGTEAAVKLFQTNRSLVADGIVGPKTWAELRIPGHIPHPLEPDIGGDDDDATTAPGWLARFFIWLTNR